MVKIVRKLSVILHLFLFVAMFMAAPSLVYSVEVKVKPGKFDHFNISMPEQMNAGEDVQIKLTAVDSFNNTIINFGDSKRSFLVSATGSAVVKPSTFDTASIVNGSMTLIFTDKTAESGMFTIAESGNKTPILSREFLVVPNKLSNLILKSPRTVNAGERFEVAIIERDAFGNLVSEPIYTKNVDISFKGNTELRVELPLIPEFKKGIGAIGFVAEKAGSVMIEVKDLMTGSSGTSEMIDITNGPLHSFRLLYPKEVTAGEPFDFSIIPVDRFGNLILNYAAGGSGVQVTSSGKQKPFPSAIPASEFINGQAKVALRYDEADVVKIHITDIDTKRSNSSNTILFVPPIFEKFEIVTPESIVAGEKFKVKITAYNQFSYVINNYNLVGMDVLLSTTGTGTLIPNRLKPADFVNGTAVVYLQYNKSEAFDVTARAVNQSAASEVPESSLPAKAAEAKKIKELKKELSAADKPFEVKDISVSENNDKAAVAIHIDNIDKNLKYKVSTEKTGGKRWIVVKITPAVNKTEGKISFDSSFVSSAVIEQDKKDKDTVVVKIELLKRAFYHVSKGLSSLNVMLKM